MASKFSKAKVAQGIKEVAQTSNEQANLITIKYYNDEDLLDYKRNNEDITNTEDIEKSIEEQGFTDPIEITDFGCEDGKYTILSGHRRRMAGRNRGMKKFPCILKHFKSESDVYNYVLYSNSQRDSAKDPLLFARRYKMHEEYLKETGFKGSMREEIASRLGIKVAQADRYNAMNKVILPVWDMITEGVVGMSSITDSGMYTQSTSEQEEILQIMKECLDAGNELTRPIMKKIVSCFRGGKKTWIEVTQGNIKETLSQKEIQEPVIPHGEEISIINDTFSNEQSIKTENNDREQIMQSEKTKIEQVVEDENIDDEEVIEDENTGNVLTTQDENTEIEQAIQDENTEINDNKEEKKDVESHSDKNDWKIQIGEKLIKSIDGLDTLLDERYLFESNDKAEDVIDSMTLLINRMLPEMYSISKNYKQDDVFEKSLKSIIKIVERYK